MQLDTKIHTPIFSKRPDLLGEGPIWHPVENKLYWIDIVKHTINTFDPKKNNYQTWVFDNYVGAVVPRKKGGLLVAADRDIFHLNTDTGEKTILHHKVIDQCRVDYRFNDGKCDRFGRFWVGVASVDTENPAGGLYCLDLDGSITQKEKAVTISNGLGWSPDNKIFYYTDGLRYCVYQYDFDIETGNINNRRVFLQLKKSPIEPDGLTVDSKGNVWQAQWNSHKIFCYRPDGVLIKAIEMPVERPTSCIFGGENYSTLFITSCSKAMGETESKPVPAGAIFAVNVGAIGLPEPMYGG